MFADPLWPRDQLPRNSPAELARGCAAATQGLNCTRARVSTQWAYLGANVRRTSLELVVFALLLLQLLETMTQAVPNRQDRAAIIFSGPTAAPYRRDRS